MFAEAIRRTRNFTPPIVLSHRRMDGQCGAGAGAYVVVNPEGWALSAWHIFEELQRLRDECDLVSTTEDRRRTLTEGVGIEKRERSRSLKALPKLTSEMARNHSVWLGMDGVRPVDVVGLKAVDLAIFRLEPFDPSWVLEYPVFYDPPTELPVGTALCRLGYPFHQISPEWVEESQSFRLPEGSLPMPVFANEGILSRLNEIGLPKGATAPPFPLGMMETSSPGLKGQSGGPIFDPEGRVWGIQSGTRSYHLGFEPPVPGGRKGEVVHQFLNVGLGVHPATIVGVLRDRGIAFASSSD